MLKKILRGAATVVPLIILDRLTKILAMEYRPRQALIPGVIGLNYAENTGAAFSFFRSAPWLVGAVSAFIVIALTALLLTDKTLSRTARFGLWAVVAGGLGNLYDRLAYGFVVDFIEPLFIDFAIFNFADICVCCGAFLACAVIILGDARKGKSAEGAERG